LSTRRSGAFVGLALCAVTGVARAQLAEVQAGNAPLASTDPEATSVRYWERGRKRVFVAATLELGVPYLRLQLATGKGRPHYSWLGLEGNTGVSTGSFGQFLGLRGTLPWATLRGGVRYQAAFQRSVLPIQESYTRTDLDTPIGDPWQYFVLEGEATATAHLPVGDLTGVVSGHYLTLVPERDTYIFEESLKVVAAPPWLWRARGSYSYSFGRDNGGRLGAAGEVIGIPGRDDLVVRAGMFASVAIDNHLEVVATLMPVWYSPDSLGLLGADFGQLGIRLRYATDENQP